MEPAGFACFKLLLIFAVIVLLLRRGSILVGGCGARYGAFW
jgi:hypothetical protein